MPRAVTIGADPEFPIYSISKSRIGGNTYVPVCGLIGGDKGKPVEIGPEGGWLEDGVMLELNPTPSSDPMQLAKNTSLLFGKANTILAKTKMALAISPTGYYKAEDLMKFPQAMQFGCAPDLNAYDRGAPRACPMEDAMREHGAHIRFAGGHIHFGIKDWPNELPKFIAVRFLDLFVGRPHKNVRRTVYMGDSARDDFYGLPGLFRETSYGLEYRTPCNHWVQECNDHAPHLLTRARLVAELFADFENTRADLVNLYNSVNWDAFYSAFTSNSPINLHEILSTQEMVAERNALRIGPYILSLTDHRINKTKDGTRLPHSFDPSNPKASVVTSKGIRMDYDDRDYDVVYYRSGDPDNQRNGTITGRDGPEWEQYWARTGGRVVDYDDGVMYVEFPDNADNELLPDREIANDDVAALVPRAPFDRIVEDAMAVAEQQDMMRRNNGNG